MYIAATLKPIQLKLTAISLENSLIALIIGVIASALFLLIISRFKPSIKIADKIACTYSKVNGINKQLYSFKIINRSWVYRIYDVQVRVFMCENVSSQNGEDITHEEVTLRKNYQWVLHKLNLKHLWQDIFIKEERLNSRTDYAAQFSTFDNLKHHISDKKFITFEVIAKHSLTGFSVVRTKSYKHINEIKKGNFLSGNTFKIEEIISVDQ
ncbi:MAG TPA: hypothetical protein VIM89_10690 [Mucilaginibacter sp.]